MLVERDARTALGSDIHDRLLNGEQIPGAMQTVDEIFRFYGSNVFLALNFLVAFIVSAPIG